MNEQELVKFVKWLPTIGEEFKDKNPDEIVGILNKMSKTKEGLSMISSLIEEFKKTDSSEMFKNGGKLSFLINKLQKGGKTISTPNGPIYETEDGTYRDSYGRDVEYKMGAISEWRANRAANKRLREDLRVDSTYHDIFGPTYTRTTFGKILPDTIVSRDGKFYSNSIGRDIKKFVTGTSSFDQINRAIDSISGRPLPRYFDGGKTESSTPTMRVLGKFRIGNGTHYGVEYKYNDGTRRQHILQHSPDSTDIVQMNYPTARRTISSNNRDTVYRDRLYFPIRSGNLEDNISLFGGFAGKSPYLPWNKDEELQKIKNRKQNINDAFDKLK